MTIFGIFDPLDPLDAETDYASIEEFLAVWDRQQHDDAGPFYVYAFRDAAGSAFYIGKGQGTRAHDAEGHRHGRLGYYVAKFLSGTYTVAILRDKLSPDDAESLEARLIQMFGPQLVNWAGNFGSVLTKDVVTQLQELRPTLQAERTRARAAAAGNRLEEAIAICQQVLANLSKWERTQHEVEIHELEQVAAAALSARVDLHKTRSDYVPQAPVLACEVLSDLTRYLCLLGRAEEARREVEAFTDRYPRGSFRDYEFFDHRYGRNLTTAVTKRELATLRRIERALETKGRSTVNY